MPLNYTDPRVIALLNDPSLAPTFKQYFVQAYESASLGGQSQDVRAYNSSVAIAQTKLAAEVNPSRTSAGNLAQEDGTTSAQNPAPAPTVLTTPGRVNPSQVESGTNAPVVTLAQSQATPASPAVVYSPPTPANSATTTTTSPSTATAATPKTQAGAGATSEDTATKNATQTTVDNVFGSGPLVPQPNVLDKYSSYTYQASFYIMKPEAWNAMVKSKKKNLAGCQLLFQSGGAAVNGRNPYFTNDYYIDKFEIKSTIMGKGTGNAHNANRINMTLVEPNGITFLENLDKAVTDYLGTTGNPPKKKNWSSQLYLLVVRFYGYDENGLIVQAGQTATGTTGTTPQTAFVEKYYPVQMNNVKFKIANKLVEYEIELTAIQYQNGLGQLKPIVPYNIEISSGTLQDALNGNAVVELGSVTSTSTNTAAPARDETGGSDGITPNAPAPQTAASAPTNKLTVRQGLIDAINNFQKAKVGTEITYPDKYSVEFVTNAIAQAKIKRVGQDKTKDPMPVGGTAAEQKLPEKQSMDTSTRTLSISAGVTIVQVLDQLLKNCTYIEDQQTVKVLEESGYQLSNGAAAKNLSWYKISMEATAGQFDPKRNEYAMNIKYIVAPYKISDMISNYFTSPKYNGVHKQYNYWFTGENTQVLSYEQNFNALYYQVMTGAPPSGTTSGQSEVKLVTATRSGQSSQGAQGRTNEPAANAADYLYSAGDNNNCVMTIVGDPAWLQQGEASFGPSRSNFEGFLPDGTINFDSQQILFEVLFNVPGDYDLNTGLMNPNGQEAVSNTSTSSGGAKPGQAKRSYIFLATTCESQFVKGKFTQVLKGVKIAYFGDQAQKSAANARPPTANAAAATGTTSTGNASRLPNSGPGPQGIPTNQPSAAGPSADVGSYTPPTAGTQYNSTSGGVPVFQQNQLNQDLTNQLANNANPQALQPATVPVPPPQSDGGIEPVRSITTPTVATTDLQQQTATVAAAESGSTGLSIPAPPVLPSGDPGSQYEAKLNQLALAQVNTNPPQDIVKDE